MMGDRKTRYRLDTKVELNMQYNLEFVEILNLQRSDEHGVHHVVAVIILNGALMKNEQALARVIQVTV